MAVEKTRCSRTMTEAAFRGWILSALRSLTRKWKPANDAWKLNTRPNTSGVGRHRVEHQCALCSCWAPRKTKANTFGIELDHKVAIGGLSCFSKLEQWIRRAFVEVPDYQKLCTNCHAVKTKGERDGR